MTTKEIPVDIIEADLHLLHKQLGAGKDAVIKGVVRDKNGYRLVVDDAITQAELVQARAICNAHDPADKPVKDIEAEKVRAKAGKFDDQIEKITDANVYDILLRLKAEIDELKGKK